MVILHIASVGKDLCNGMDIVVPQHIQAQAEFATIGFINIQEINFPDIEQQLQ